MLTQGVDVNLLQASPFYRLAEPRAEAAAAESDAMRDAVSLSILQTSPFYQLAAADQGVTAAAPVQPDPSVLSSVTTNLPLFTALSLEIAEALRAMPSHDVGSDGNAVGMLSAEFAEVLKAIPSVDPASNGRLQLPAAAAGMMAVPESVSEADKYSVEESFHRLLSGSVMHRLGQQHQGTAPQSIEHPFATLLRECAANQNFCQLVGQQQQQQQQHLATLHAAENLATLHAAENSLAHLLAQNVACQTSKPLSEGLANQASLADAACANSQGENALKQDNCESPHQDASCRQVSLAESATRVQSAPLSHQSADNINVQEQSAPPVTFEESLSMLLNGQLPSYTAVHLHSGKLHETTLPRNTNAASTEHPPVQHKLKAGTIAIKLVGKSKKARRKRRAENCDVSPSGDTAPSPVEPLVRTVTQDVETNTGVDTAALLEEMSSLKTELQQTQLENQLLRKILRELPCVQDMLSKHNEPHSA